MDNNKKFELNDEALDEVAGGAVTDADYAACPFPHNSLIRNKQGKHCPKCYDGPGLYDTKCFTARIRYSYATPPQVTFVCSRCGSGFMEGDINKSIFPHNSSEFSNWELA